MPSQVDVLVVAARHTREADGVIDELRSRRLSVSRFEVCQYPEHKSISWTPANAHEVYGTPRAGWLCDFSGWSFEDRLTGLQRETATSESVAFLEGSLLALQCKWLNPPQIARSASRKLLQLSVARQLGLTLPETCVTNSPVEARQFCSTYAKVIAKTLGMNFINYAGEHIKFYTRRVGADSDKIFDALRFGPLIFQTEIEKKEEIRVTIVDSEAFAVRLDLSGIGNHEIDIRRYDYKTHRSAFSACRHRPELLELSTKIVRALGLSYGGIDWAIDKDGAAYFLECNPLGAFKWFELCGGHDITRAIARALERRCQP